MIGRKAFVAAGSPRTSVSPSPADLGDWRMLAKAFNINGRHCRILNMLHSMKVSKGVSDNHWLMLVLVLVAKDAAHGCGGLDPRKKPKIKKIRVNTTKVVFLDGKSYKTRWNQSLTPDLLMKIVGRGVLLIDDADAHMHAHVYHRVGQLWRLESDEKFALGCPKRHSPATLIESAEMGMFNSLIKSTTKELESGTDMRSIMPDDRTVTAYDPEIVSRCIKKKTLEIKLADNKKAMVAREFRKSGSVLGLAYKGDQIEYVLANGEPPRCVNVQSMLKDAMGISPLAKQEQVDSGRVV